MADLNPVAIILVTSGTRGDRLLFRYPFESENIKENYSKSRLNNPYALKIAEDRHLSTKITTPTLIKNDVLVGFEDKTLANLLAVKTKLCGSKFNLKIDDVRFVGYPVHLEYSVKTASKQDQAQVRSLFFLKKKYIRIGYAITSHRLARYVFLHSSKLSVTHFILHVIFNNNSFILMKAM